MNSQDQNLPTDFLETITPANPSTPDAAEDSPISNFDAGLNEEDKGSDEYSRREIPITDLTDASRENSIHSPELADMNVPGEIDIEDLDENAVMEALPADARLDPLED